MRNEFCDNQGRYLKSGAEVFTYSKYYTQDVMDQFQNFSSISLNRRKMDASSDIIANKGEFLQHQQSNQSQDSIHPRIEQSNKKQRSRNNLQWKTDDILYPAGWLYASENGKRALTVFQTPGGKFLKGPRNALKFLIDNNSLESDISMLRAAMLQNRWKTDSKLPQNWFYRVKRDFKGTPKGTLFVDSTGKLYEGKEPALKSLTKEDEIKKLRVFQAS